MIASWHSALRLRHVVNKKAQLSPGKTRYSLYSSCCSTDLQGHPSSMIFMSFKRQYATFYRDL